MRTENGKRSRKGLFNTAKKLGILACITTLSVPGLALAQESCNGFLEYTVDSAVDPGGPIFLGDTVTGHIELGAGQIDGGTYQDITAFGFMLNCNEREDYASCTSAGNTITRPEEFVTNCGVELGKPESNLVPIVATPPIRSGEGETCDVYFDFAVTELADSDNRRIIQAAGWPVTGLPATTCNNGLTSSASSTTAFNVQSCDIELEKQVFDPETETWVDADSVEAAVSLVNEAQYRLVVTNTGTAGYVQDITVTDGDLGIGTTYTFPADSNTLILGNAEISGLTDPLRCRGQGEISNLASVGAVCRAGDNAITASASDIAWVDCAPTSEENPLVNIEKYTNGEDADTPTGPVVTVGSTVLWTYVVSNKGSTPLVDIVVTDDQGVVVSCPENALPLLGEMTCTGSGIATEGQYANIGTVTAKSPTGFPLIDTDPSHYMGVLPPGDIKVEKSVENVEVNDDGTLDVRYRVTVSNSGGQSATYDLDDELMVDEALTAESVESGVTYVAGTEDDQDGALNDTLAVEDFDPKASLVTGESLAAGKAESFDFIVNFSIDGDLTTVEGANCDPDDDGGTNTGLTNYVEVLVGNEVVDYARACKEFDLTPDILIVKEIWDGDEWVETAGPVEAPSGALYRLTVTNTGNIALLSVVVTDPMLGDPETVYYEFGPLLVGEEYVIEAGQGADGSWPLLDVDEVCGEDDRGDHTNTATAAGMWEVDGDTVKDNDMATLQCIGPPEIAILKEISIDGGEWQDANDEPWATAVFDLPDNPVPAEYRLTVSNASTEGVDLFDVVVNDVKLGIVNYDVGDLPAGGDPVVIESGDIPALAVTSICDGIGEVDNLAEATGTSAAGESNTASDPATIECVDKPSIAVLKEVSKDGVNWSPTSVSAVSGDDAYYRITVTNDGSVDMVNVTVTDDDLDIGPIPIGNLGDGESVTVLHNVAVPADDLIEEPGLYIPGSCGLVGFTFENTAIAAGTSVYGGDSVNAQDSALYSCTVEKVDYCEDNGKPGLIKLQYNGTYDRDSIQDTPEFWGQGYYVDPPDATGPIGVSPVTVKLYDKNELEATHTGIVVGDTFDILGKWRPDGGVPPNVKVEILDGSTALQTIWFHGSCSAPLAIGDELGAVTIIGIEAKP